MQELIGGAGLAGKLANWLKTWCVGVYILCVFFSGGGRENVCVCMYVRCVGPPIPSVDRALCD